ncbi:RNA 2'-phosphotransferase [Mycolicibacter minnesotensis]
MSTVRTSRRVASVLRHDGDVERTPDGWVKVTEVLHRLGITRAKLADVLAASTRYELDPHQQRIRARYGHSIPTRTGQPTEPPTVLYHGTKWSSLTPILRDGLSPMSRQQVHLHTDPDVVVRRGAAVLAIAAQDASEQGHHFYDVGGGVWLTSAVPAQFITRAN